MDMMPILAFWCVALWAFFRRAPALIYVFFASMPFASFAVVPPEVTAGLTLTPTPVVALLIIARVLANRRGLDFLVLSILSPRRLTLLFLFWGVAVFTTFFMPRLFAGSVSVMPMRGEGYAEPLYPSAQNISQLAYTTISVFAVCAFARLLQDAGTRQDALRAMCLGAAIAIATGLLDLASGVVPIQPLLEPFRTATYALLTDVEVLGAKRVVGLMPEASSFGALCLGFLSSLYFLRRGITDAKLRHRYVPILLVLLVVSVWLSTSSAAFVGLGLFGIVVVLEWLWRATALRPGSWHRRGLAAEFWVAFSGAACLMLIIIFRPGILDPMFEMIDTLVFQKTTSQSFEERSMWTAVSWQAALDTFGLGVGLGGTRASTAVVALISNVGFLGALFYYGFIIQLFLRKPRMGDGGADAIVSGVRWALVPSFAVSALVGTVADFGTFVAFHYGLITAAALAVPAIRRPAVARRSPAPMLR